jgi:transcription-repair coupling factor (superfamily II helicase)
MFLSFPKIISGRIDDAVLPRLGWRIKEVGFELYQQMLEEAVMSLKAGITAPVADRWSPQITIGTALLIPEESTLSVMVERVSASI